MKNKLLIVLIIVILFAGLAFFFINQKNNAAKTAASLDDTWPAGKTVTIVVPWKAGGAADLMVRSFVPYWQKTAGCTFVVENREGATTMVGSVYFQTLPDDGSYLYSGTQPYISGNQILQGAKYDITDFDLLNMQQIDPTTITVHADSPYKTIHDLIAGIEKNPGQLKVGMTPGGSGEILISLFKEKLGWDVKIVTYDSGNDFRTALLGKHVDFITSSANGDLALGDKGKVIAICGERSTLWPDAPSFDEILGDISVPGSLGSCRFFAVHKTFKEKYPARYRRLLASYEEAFNDPEYQAMLTSTGEIAVSALRGPENSNKLNLELHALIDEYKDILKASQ